MQSVYSTTPADCATGHSLEESYPLRRCSQCIKQPQRIVPQDTCWRSLTPLQICSQCILQPQPTVQQDTRWRNLTPCGDAVSVLNNPSWLCHRTLVGGVLPSEEMQSVYSTSPADCTTGHSFEESYPLKRCSQCILQPQPTVPQDTRWRSLAPLRRCSQCILQPQPTVPQDIRWRSLTPPPCGDAVSVFYNPSRLCHKTLVSGILPPCGDAVSVFYNPRRLCHETLVGGVLSPAEMQSVYSTTPFDWALHILIQTIHSYMI